MYYGVSDRPMDIQREDLARRKRRRWLFWSTAALAFLSLVVATGRNLKPAVPRVNKEGLWIGAVQRGDMIRDINAHGRLVPKRKFWIAAPTGGRVESVAVEAGTLVEPDQEIVILSSPDLDLAAQDAETQVALAEAEMTTIEADFGREEAVQRAAIASARADCDQAETEAQADEELFRSGLLSDLQRKRSASQASACWERLRAEERVLSMMAESCTSRRAAQEATIAQLRANLDLKRRQVEDLTVRARQRGVVRQVDAGIGQSVAAGASLVLLEQPDDLKAELRVAEGQASEVALGQSVMVDLRTAKVSGRVTRIAPGVEEGTVTIDVEFDEPLPAGARPDLSVTGSIEVEVIEDVLYLDRPPLLVPEAQATLFKCVPSDSRAVRVTATLGKASASTIEVRSGLAESDRVILSDMSKWEHLDEIVLD